MARKNEAKINITAENRTKRAFQSVGASLGNMERQVRSLKPAFAGLLGIAGAAGFTALAKNSLNAADAIAKAADRTGFSVKALQELRFAADQTGVGITQLEGGLARFTKRLGLARAGTGAAADTYKKLGVDLSQTNEQVFRQVVTTLGNMDNATNALALTTRLFGDDAQMLYATFRDGTAGLDAFADKAHGLGLILDDELVRGAEAANDQLSIMQQVVSMQFVRVFVELAPAITAVGQAFADAAPKAAAFLNKVMGVDSIAVVEARIADWQGLKAKAEAELAKFPAKGNLRLFPWEKGPEEWSETIKRADEQIAKDIVILQDLLFKRGQNIPAATQAAGGLDPDKLFGAAGKEPAKAIKETKRAIDEMVGPALVWEKMQGRTLEIYKQTRTPLEQYTAKVKELQDLFSRPEQGLDRETYARALAQAGAELDGIKEQAEETNSAWQELGGTFSSAFEDAIVEGGKFSDVLKGLEKDILRIITRKLVTEPLAEAFTGVGQNIGGFFSSLFGRAMGGPVMAGVPYLVGEHGRPEVFIPQTNGNIVPTGRGAGVTVKNYFTVAPGSGDTLVQSQQQIADATYRAATRASRRLG